MPVCKKFYKSSTELKIHILKMGFLWNVFVSHHFPIHFFLEFIIRKMIVSLNVLYWSKKCDQFLFFYLVVSSHCSVFHCSDKFTWSRASSAILFLLCVPVCSRLRSEDSLSCCSLAAIYIIFCFVLGFMFVFLI